MKAPAFQRRVLLVPWLLAALVMSSCATPARDQDYTNSYREALSRFPGTEADPGRVQQVVEEFIALFAGLDEKGELEERISAVYAEELHFDDTLHIKGDRQELLRYLEHTGEQLKHIEVELLGYSVSGPDIHVRWSMETTFTILGRTSSPRTLGMTHLRLDEEKRVVLQQDFWDTSRGALEHVPLAGGLVRWLRARF